MPSNDVQICAQFQDPGPPPAAPGELPPPNAGGEQKGAWLEQYQRFESWRKAKRNFALAKAMQSLQQHMAELDPTDVESELVTAVLLVGTMLLEKELHRDTVASVLCETAIGKIMGLG